VEDKHLVRGVRMRLELLALVFCDTCRLLELDEEVAGRLDAGGYTHGVPCAWQTSHVEDKYVVLHLDFRERHG
jgi:hypothetical protein